MNAMTKTNERTGEQTIEQTIEQTTREQQASGGQQAGSRREQREPRSFEWVPEVLALVIVTPALVHAVMSLNNLPIV